MVPGIAWTNEASVLGISSFRTVRKLAMSIAKALAAPFYALSCPMAGTGDYYLTMAPS